MKGLADYRKGGAEARVILQKNNEALALSLNNVVKCFAVLVARAV